MEKDFCKQCGKCCENIKVDFEKKIMLFDGIQPLSDDFVSMLEIYDHYENLSVYRCKFLKNNLCTNPDKPEICRNFPSSPFANLPQNCGYEGLIFSLLEHTKQKIRKIKEDIIHYEALCTETSNKSDLKRYQKVIDSLNKNIKRYSQYGSENW